MTESIQTFDPSPYQAVPQLTAEGTLALARALVGSIPEPTPAPLERHAERLRAKVHEAEEGLTVRRRELAPFDYTEEVELDLMTDALWVLLRDRLRAWSTFERDELRHILDAEHDEQTMVLLTARDRAAIARDLYGRVFGNEGLRFIKHPYPEQAQRMASILRMIDEDGLSASIEQLVGREVMVGIRRCQQRYESMVEARMVRLGVRAVDLRQLRSALQRVVGRYTSAVITLLDENEPTTLELVRGALRPIDVVRARLSRGRGRGQMTEDSDEGLLEEPLEASDEELAEAAAE